VERKFGVGKTGIIPENAAGYAKQHWGGDMPRKREAHVKNNADEKYRSPITP